MPDDATRAASHRLCDLMVRRFRTEHERLREVLKFYVAAWLDDGERTRAADAATEPTEDPHEETQADD